MSKDNSKGDRDSRRRVYRSLAGRLWRNIRMRFNLKNDCEMQEEVAASITKSVEFRGTNLWVLICATVIASLGLNVNSTAVIIGAMLVSPLMGPILGIGLALGVNDFELLKKSLRNFMWMFVTATVTSTVFFLLSPYSNAQSELLARTSPTTYDVLIAFVGGFAGMLAQTRKDGMGTVISGVAIATALMPPLCTVGFGIANGEIRYILGALYLFLINTVFIALASYILVVSLKYEKKAELNKETSKRMNGYMLLFAVAIIVPSVIMTFNIMRKTQFEANVDRYVSSVFRFNKTMLVDYDVRYRTRHEKSRVEVRLVGEPLSQNVIDNAVAQMTVYGLTDTELHVQQADMNDPALDISRLQKSYSEIIEEKNRTIDELERRLSTVRTVDTIAASDIARELRHVADNVGSVSLSKQISYGVEEGAPCDTAIVVRLTLADPSRTVDRERVAAWLRTRLKTDGIEIYVSE